MGGRVENLVAQAVRATSVEPWPGTLPLLTTLTTRMYAIFTNGGELDDDTDLDTDAVLNAVGFVASRYGSLGVRELGALLDAGGPFREDVMVTLPASYRRAVREEANRAPTKPDFWPGPPAFAVALHDAIQEAAAEQDGSTARVFYEMGLRVAAGLYGLPDGASQADRREAMARWDVMPVFPIWAADKFAVTTLRTYRRLCEEHGLAEQARQVLVATAQMTGWRERHPRLVQIPARRRSRAGDTTPGGTR